jgi:FlaA1/EpsC-like NDP-sugar epimerase
MYSDDFSFARGYDGLNVVVTGSTGTIGSMLVDTLLKHS